MSVRAAKRYAKAFLELSTQSQTTSEVQKDMNLIEQTIANNLELRLFLENPVVTDEAKCTALLEIFSQVSGATKNLFQLLKQNKRLPLLLEVSQAFEKLYNEQEGKEVAKVTTAIAMDSTLEQEMIQKAKELSSSVVAVENIVDPSIIGGFIIRVGDQQIDASIASKLNHLRNTFVQ